MISVCIATYNGEVFVKSQLESILSQLDLNDEVIVVDDCSKDLTTNIIEDIHDSRIKLFTNTHNLGFVKTFERAISLTHGDIIFFSDQDDFWLPGRVATMVSELVESNSLLLVSQFHETSIQGVSLNCSETKELGNSFTWTSIFLGGSNFFGSTMCIDRKILKYILPFNFYVTAHDLHISIIAKMLGRIRIINNIYTLRTLTGNNLSAKRRSFVSKFLSRFNYFFSILHLVFVKFK
jgi:glycosyltransferase involved in cell wall biosynthesis